MVEIITVPDLLYKCTIASLVILVAQYLWNKCKRVYIIDCHVHVIDNTSLKQAGNAPKLPLKVFASDIHEIWDKSGIAMGVLSQPSFYGKNNDAIWYALGQCRFRASMDLDWRTLQIHHLKRWHDLGGRGLRINYFRSPKSTWPDLADKQYEPLYKWMRENGWHLEIYARASQFNDLIPKLLATNVTLLIDHFGMPIAEDDGFELGFESLLKAGQNESRVFVMLSGDFRFSHDQKYVQRIAQRLLTAFGPEKLVWASDYPFTRYEKLNLTVEGQLKKMETWIPNEDARKQILEVTPLGLYGF